MRRFTLKDSGLAVSYSSLVYIPYSSGSVLQIGRHFTTDGILRGFYGYIDELRISNIARYDSNFTPSIQTFVVDGNTKLLMHFEDLVEETGRVVTPAINNILTFLKPDNAPDLGPMWGWGNGGAGTTLISSKRLVGNLPNNPGIYSVAGIFSNFTISGNFDIQMDVGLNSLGGTSQYLAYGWLGINIPASKIMLLRMYAYTSRVNCAGGSWSNNTWNWDFWNQNDVVGIGTPGYAGKVRYVRSGSSCTGYYWNGSNWVSVGTHNSFGTGDIYITLNIVENNAPGLAINAWIDNFQVNSGAINFTEPGRVSTNTKKFGTKSLKCDGDMRYLSIPNSIDWGFGFDDFTIEAWLYLLDNSQDQINGTIMSYDDNSGVGWAIQYRADTKEIVFALWKGAQVILNTRGIVSSSISMINIWNHVSIVRRKGNLLIFINGQHVRYT
jgi:hypothetical protein